MNSSRGLIWLGRDSRKWLNCRIIQISLQALHPNTSLWVGMCGSVPPSPAAPVPQLSGTVSQGLDPTQLPRGCSNLSSLSQARGRRSASCRLFKGLAVFLNSFAGVEIFLRPVCRWSKAILKCPWAYVRNFSRSKCRSC